MANPVENTQDKFSYEGDIQPLMSNYFTAVHNLGLKGGAAANMVQQERNRLQASATRDLEVKQRSQQFEVTRLQLEEARRKAASAVGLNDAVSQFGRELTAAIDAPDDQRRDIMSKLGVVNGNLINRDDTAKIMYQSATQSLSGSSRRGQEAEAMNSVLSGLDKVEFGEDIAKRPTGKFKDEVHSSRVLDVIDLLGSPEDKQAALKATAQEQYNIARNIRNARIKKQLQGSTPSVEGPRSLFGKKPEVPLP